MQEQPGGGEADETKALTLIESGAEVIGALAGGALGTLGGPLGIAAGAIGGVAVTRAIQAVGAEIHDRLLAPRAHARAGAALATVAVTTQRKLEEGKREREDGFFTPPNEHERASGWELLEGTLLKAAESYEERKVPLLGRMYANLAFDEDVNPVEANFLLKLVDRLTYQQLMFLRLFAQRPQDDALINLDVARGEGDWRPRPDVVAALNDLGNADLIGITQGSGGEARGMRSSPTGDVLSAGLGKIALRPLALTLSRLMELDEQPVSDEELEELFGVSDRRLA